MIGVCDSCDESGMILMDRGCVFAGEGQGWSERKREGEREEERV